MAKKKTTRARLVERAAAAKGGPKVAVAPAKPQARSRGLAKAGKVPDPGAGGLEIPGLQVGDVQETVRNVVTYVQQNPLAAAAVAIGVGVMLTSMYWESTGEKRSKR